MILTKRKLSIDGKFFLLIFVTTMTVFIFTNDGHRYTFDEDVTQHQSLRIATLEPDPRYVQGESTLFFEYPEYFPDSYHVICQNAILCSSVPIGSSLTQVPFILINHNFHIITKDIVWTTEDFNDPHYVWWRNSLEPDFTFLELFYGPVFSALSVGTFFLVSRTFDFTQKSSIILALLYGFTTITWAYSKTSLNVVPVAFFVLLGILFFRKFQKSQSNLDLVFCGTSLGFAFLTRYDAALIITPLFLFLLYSLRQKNEKAKKFFSFIVPITLSYGIHYVIEFVRLGSSGITSPANFAISGDKTIPLYMSIFGLLFAPGVGLLIFAPILLTTFLAFSDFYKRNKFECLLFLSFIIIFLIFYGISSYWHGLNAWGARYLSLIVPFLLLPLGASIEKRKNKFFKISLVILGGLGVFFNLVYVIQDVTWFVWGDIEGLRGGLYSLGRDPHAPLRIHPLTIWTFEYSQLTHSILRAFYHLQPDIFLLKILGPQIFTLIFVAIITPLTYFLLRLLSQNKLTITKP